VIVIEEDGTAVAEMRPIERIMLEKLKTLWDSLPQTRADSGKFLEEDR
jgi:hypothetical protein